MRVPHFRTNHKGGQLQFGPDGMLYAGFGDGGGGGDPDENAQNLGRILGKLIRIDPRPGGGYSIPSSNPFARPRRVRRHEIYAYGLRNPYRFSFDRRRGSLDRSATSARTRSRRSTTCPAAAGGGQPRGGYNFGWDVFEGRNRYEDGSAPGHVPPVIAHRQDAGFCSIIGGYVIRDRVAARRAATAAATSTATSASPELRLRSLKRPRAPSRGTGLRVSEPGLLRRGRPGRVYAVSMDGPIYRIGRR